MGSRERCLPAESASSSLLTCEKPPSMALARGQYCGMYSSSAPTDWTSACSSFSCWSGLLAVGEADLAHDFQVDDFQVELRLASVDPRGELPHAHGPEGG